MSKHNRQKSGGVRYLEQLAGRPDGGPAAELLALTQPSEEPSPPLRDLPGPYAIGWALRAVADGYIRVRVRIPLDVLEELAIGPASPPDLRSNQAAWVSREIMQDEALQQIHAGRVGK